MNPNTNLVYVAGMTSPTSLDVVDGSTYQVVASIPGLPDQSADCLIAGYLCMTLPRAIVVNTRTNGIYAVNSASTTISVVDGNTNTLSGTISVPAPDGAAVGQPYQAGTQLAETKPGNTRFNSSTGMITPLGGAIAIAIDEAANRLYVASVNGTIGVYALDAPVAVPPNTTIVPSAYTLSPWTLLGAGVKTTGTVTLNHPAPTGGAAVALLASDAKAVKVAASVTVPAGQSSASFPVQGNGVSSATTVMLTAQYNGGTASTSVTVAPSDKITNTSATYSQSTQVLSVTATDSNAQATLQVFLGSNNQLLGTMANQGGGSFTLQVVMAARPASVNLVSNLGARAGLSVTVAP